MEKLLEFIKQHSIRGECTCGKCIDGGTKQPEGHTADLIFFKVAAVNEPNAEELKRLIQSNKEGDFENVDLFDGKEHGYIELGAWIGDQGMALVLMGLGNLLGLWNLLTPRTILGNSVPDDMINKMAGQGYLTIQAKE